MSSSTGSSGVQGTFRCRCNASSPMQVASTNENYGRRFHGCGNWKSGKKCRYFDWVDEQFSDRAREVISDLRGDIASLKKSLEESKGTDAEKAKLETEMNALGDQKEKLEVEFGRLIEDNIQLEDSVNYLSQENERLKLENTNLRQANEKEKEKKWFCFFVLLVLWGLWIKF